MIIFAMKHIIKFERDLIKMYELIGTHEKNT